MLKDREAEELAMRVVNLRRALEQANEIIKMHANARGLKGYLLVGCRETQGPTFCGGRKFWAEVRALLRETAEG